MKKKLGWLVIILIGIAVIFSLVGNNETVNNEFKPLELNVGDEFTYIDYEGKMYVLNYLLEDVTGDGKKDMVIVIGEKSSVEDTNATNMDLVIFEPNEAKFFNLNLKKFNGELPTLNAKELTGDGINDIVLSANDENGNILIRVATFENAEFKEILKSKDNKGIVFSRKFY